MNLDKLKSWVPNPLKRVMRRTWQNIWESARYLLSVQKFDSRHIRHVVFVCKGNICRSAFAEYYLKKEFPEETHKIESCGLDVDQGLFSPPEAVCIAKEFGLDLETHQSKSLMACDLQNADLILPMEFRQYQRLNSTFPSLQGKIKLLRDFAPWPDRLLCNIADPFGTSGNEFRRCFRLLQKSLDGLKRYLT